MKNLLLSVAVLPLATIVHAECLPDYTGVTLTISTQNGPYVASALQTAAESWEAKTCGEVNLVEFPFGELYPKFLTGMSQ